LSIYDLHDALLNADVMRGMLCNKLHHKHFVCGKRMKVMIILFSRQAFLSLDEIRNALHHVPLFRWLVVIVIVVVVR